MKGDLPGAWTFEMSTGSPLERIRVIQIIENEAGGPEPQPEFDFVGVAFNYPDGRRVIFPWAHIVRADYKPTAKT